MLVAEYDWFESKESRAFKNRWGPIDFKLNCEPSKNRFKALLDLVLPLRANFIPGLNIQSPVAE